MHPEKDELFGRNPVSQKQEKLNGLDSKHMGGTLG
jgi:hypothetical protein